MTADTIEQQRDRLRASHDRVAQLFPGESGERQPVHTVYGGAQIFSASTALKLGAVAKRAFAEYAPTVEEFAQVFCLHDRNLAALVYHRVAEKLSSEPVEDFRIDFEDGYGSRSDEEEDGHAVSAARETARGLTENSLPPFLGIRIKPLSRELADRSLRTLELYLRELLSRTKSQLPQGFCVTLPKVVEVEEVEVLSAVLAALEEDAGLRRGSIRVELMVETPQSVVSSQGQIALPGLVSGGGGRVRGVHFGTYDYTASMAITAAFQEMSHPVCDFAKHIMQVSMSGRGIWLSDGATNILPVVPHRGEALSEIELRENQEAVQSAWRLHAKHTRQGLEGGFYQGWDLHPAQLVSRYATVYGFFLESLESAGQRLRNFVEKAAQATLVGDVFDDAATGQGLLNYFLRAVNCGAISVQEAQEHSGLILDELRSRSFLKILNGRKATPQ